MKVSWNLNSLDYNLNAQPDKWTSKLTLYSLSFFFTNLVLSLCVVKVVSPSLNEPLRVTANVPIYLNKKKLNVIQVTIVTGKYNRFWLCWTQFFGKTWFYEFRLIFLDRKFRMSQFILVKPINKFSKNFACFAHILFGSSDSWLDWFPIILISSIF